MVLASLDAVAGLLIANWGTQFLMSIGPADLPAIQSSKLNNPTLLFAVILALITTVLVALIPAYEMARRDPHENLHDRPRGMTSRMRTGRFRRVLVMVEGALCTGLLAVAGLLLHSFVNVMSVDRGFAVEKILAIDLALSERQYPTSRTVAFYQELIDGIRALPDVMSAGAVSVLPLVREGDSTQIYLETDTKSSLDRPVSVYRNVTAGYFATMEIPLLAGRLFTEQER